MTDVGGGGAAFRGISREEENGFTDASSPRLIETSEISELGGRDRGTGGADFVGEDFPPNGFPPFRPPVALFIAGGDGTLGLKKGFEDMGAQSSTFRSLVCILSFPFVVLVLNYQLGRQDINSIAYKNAV